MEYVEWLASAEYYVAIPTLDNSEYTRLLESSAMHYKLVLDNTKDSKLYSQALHGIVLALSCNQKKDEAKQYAMLEGDEEKRDEMLCWCLEGEEKKKHCQHLTNRKLNLFLFQLNFGQDSIESYDAVEKNTEYYVPGR